MAPGGTSNSGCGVDNVERTFVVLSGKGGVGKSTVAVGLAVAAATGGLRVGLLDSDVHGPSASKMLGLETTRCGVASTGGLEPIALCGDSLKVMSIQ